jgi:hypothetical protein
MNCEYLKDGRCDIAEKAASHELGLQLICVPSAKACERCLATRKPDPDRPSVQAMALVTKQVSGEKLETWLKFFEWILRGKPRGFGDRVAKVARATGVATVVKAVSKATGKDCGCSQRQAALNRLLPAAKEPPESA